jgi:hypothetical protein
MRHLLRLSVTILILTILVTPTISTGQQATIKEDEGAFYLGSFIISILHFPLKLTTCLATQAGAAATYAATYGVPGNYEGTTNGKDIGEVARGSCSGDWLITPEQIKKDYGN